MDSILGDLPLEIIEHCIVPYCPVAWLVVSKKWHQIAINNIVNDPKAISRANQMLKIAILARNYQLAAVLLRDPRYTSPSALNIAVGAAYEDKKSNMLFVQYPAEGLQVDRIFQRAVTLNWLDVIQDIITKKLFKQKIIFRTGVYHAIKAEALELFIEDPNLETIDTEKFDKATYNYDKRVAEICLRAKSIDLYPIVKRYGNRQDLLDKFLKLPKLYEPDNINALWEAIGYCHDDRLEMVKEVIAKYNLDPSAESNHGLRVTIKNSSKSSVNIIKLLLDDERVIITLEPYDINPLVIALKEAARGAIPILLEHPKIDVNWIDDIVKHFLEVDESIYGLEIINRKYKHLVTNHDLLDLIPARIAAIKEQVDEYSYFYAPDYWSDNESLEGEGT